MVININYDFYHLGPGYSTRWPIKCEGCRVVESVSEITYSYLPQPIDELCYEGITLSSAYRHTEDRVVVIDEPTILKPRFPTNGTVKNKMSGCASIKKFTDLWLVIPN